jgi:hypothetical protein
MIIKPSHKGLDLARGIRAAGRPIYIKEDDGEPTDDLSDGLLIYLFGEVNDSLATNFLGGTAFILKANITVNLPGFAISGFGLEFEWDCAVDFLADPREGERPDVYRFGGRDLPEYKRGQVLNHCADVCHTYPRGFSLSGYLLGMGNKPIPNYIQHGMMIPGFLTVFDQFFRPIRSPISLWADRNQKRLHRTRSTRKRLFDCPDRGYGHSLLKRLRPGSMTAAATAAAD